MDSFNLWMHTYTPTIEVSDVNGEVLFSYQSLIIPRIGENICWKNDGKDMNAKVNYVYHEIIGDSIGNRCSKIYISVDDIQEI